MMLLPSLSRAPGAAPARTAATVTFVLGAVSLIGWLAGIQMLTSIIPGAVEMKFNTALGFIFCSSALLLLAQRPTPLLEKIGQVFSCLAACLGAATLAQYAFDWDLKIDELLVHDAAGAYNVFRGRMSPATATGFVALGSALTAMPYAKLKDLTKLGALTGVGIAAISLLGYLWDAGEIVTDQWLPPVALNTAICLFLIGGGILQAPSGADVRLRERLASLAAVELRMLAGFLLAFSLLLIGGGFTYRTHVLFAESAGWIAHTQEVRVALASTFGSLAGAELAQRDYLLSSDPARRADYKTLTAEVQDHLNDLARLTRDSAGQQANLAALREVVDLRIAGMVGALRAFDTFGLQAARAVIALDRKANYTAKVHQQIERMDRVEVRYLSARQATSATVRRTTLLSLLATLTVATAIFVLLFRGIHREMTSRRRSEEELLEANRFLDSLIASLPVMVVLKDAERLTFVRQNRAFEQVFGYRPDELEGKTAYDLFTPAEADFIVAKDREALAAGGLIDIPEQTIITRQLGARTFHTMKMPLGGRQDAPQFLLAISIDVTERKLSETAIAELNGALLAKAEQLESTNKELESFSYSISHDLRAPLRAIDGFAMMVEEDYSGRLDDEGRRYLRVIRDNSKRMGELIDDLLAFSRLGRQAMVRRDVNVGLLVREVIQELLLEPQLKAPHFEIGELPDAFADRALLKQVWTNLLSNAIKYSGKAANPCIDVGGKRVADEICFSIKDNGVGFDMEYAEKLFGVFQRLHRADEFSGTGVGLAIVQRVVAKHGGRVWAEGKVDQGAEFSFALPAGAIDAGT